MRATIHAEPEAVALDLSRTALIIIDMQRDFLEPGGFGETLGNDVSLLGRAVAPVQGRARRRARAPACWSSTRAKAIAPISPTRPQAKVERGAAVACASATPGPMGRILIRGEPGHDIIPELYPRRRRAGDRQAGQGRVLRDRPRRDAAATAASSTCSSAASPPRSASTPRCARRTTAAIAASCSPTAAPPTSRNSTRSACDDQGAGRRSSAGSRTRQRRSRRSAAGAASLPAVESGERIMATTTTATYQAEALDAGRLERVLRLRHQHPRQPAGADRPAALRAEDAGRARVRPHPAGARADDVPVDHATTRGSPTGWRRRPAAPTSARCPRASACRTCSSSRS